MRGFISATALVCSCLVFLPTARAENETRALLEKAIKAHGGAEKLDRQKTTYVKTKGTAEVPGAGKISFTQEGYTQLPNQLKQTIEAEVAGQNVTVVSVINGAKVWAKAGGQTLDVSDMVGDKLKDTFHQQQVQTLTPLRDKSYELSPLGELKVNDKPAIGVRVAKKGFRDINLYFDKESGLLVKVEGRSADLLSQKEATQETIFKEYMDVDGLQVPKKTIIYQDGKEFGEVETLEYKVLDKLDDNEFAKP